MINERGWRGEPTCGNYRAQRERRHHIGHYRDRKSSAPTTCRAGRPTDCGVPGERQPASRHHNQKCSLVVSVPFLSFLSPFSFPRLEVAPQIQPRDLGSTVSSVSAVERHCSNTGNVPWALNTRPANAFLMYLESRERVWWLRVW